MYILGIETSCDDTGVAVVKDGVRVVSNLVSSQIDLHRDYGGVVPEIASRAHIQHLLPLVEQCLHEAQIGRDDLDAIAVTHTPGLTGCLLTGISFAKAFAYSLHKPLLGVQHLEAHVYTSILDQPPENHPPFPHLSLLVSGGHTVLYRVDGWTDLHYLGGTMDDAAGEAFDKAAKSLQLGFPGGPIIQKTADGYDGEFIHFTRPVMNKGYEFSFSGLKTAVINRVNALDELTREDQVQIAASFQEAAIDVLVTKTLRAAQEENLHHISLVGGVSANEPLRQRLLTKAEKRGYKVYLPHKRFSVDNGAMVAGIAHHYLKENKLADLTLNAKATQALGN